MTLPNAWLEVTDDPKVKVYTERNQNTYIKALLQLDVHDPRYLKSKLGTLCNRLVHDACVVLGCSMPRMGDWPMLANDMVSHWRRSDEWQKMVWQDAVMSAQLGFPTVFGLQGPKHGHVGIVLPCDDKTMDDMLVMQAGATNFYGRQIKYSFTKDALPYVEFYGRS